jgi:dTDP-4-dehydrorhamnose reductase
MTANALGPELLALACRKMGVPLITISTDYVFDGAKEGFYTEHDEPHPLSVYGWSKLEGERRAQAAWARTVVVRSGYIFGTGGTNFLSTMIARARRGERLKAISNMVGTPTYAPDLALRIYELARVESAGIFHVVNAGAGATFEEFARFALKTAGLNQNLVESISLESLHRPAPRPHNSKLRCLVSETLGLTPLPPWEEAVTRFIAAE